MTIISHVEFVARDGSRVHESLSRHLRQLEVGARIMVLCDGSLRRLGMYGRPSTARPIDHRVYQVVHVAWRRATRTTVELVLAHECQSHTLGSCRMEVPPAP